MPRGVAAIAAFAALACHGADETPDPGSEPMRIEGTAPWGTIKRVVEPEYPQALRDAKVRGYVDISGRVTYLGALVDAIYTPGSEEARLMVEPLREVMKYWTFVPPKDRDCLPSGRVVKNRVWFDFEEERPKLSVSHAPDSPRGSPALKALTRVDPKYPRSGLRNAWQSFVFTRLTIDSDGNVTDVIATAYPREEGVDLSHFEQSSMLALRKWTFNAAPGSPSRFACYEIFFRLN